MRAAVNNAVRELGYRPNSLARGLRRQRSMSIGFSVSDVANPITADIVQGAERELRAAGYSMILTNAGGDADLDADNIGLLEDRQVDGLLLSLTHEDHPEAVRAMRESALPIVLLDRDRPDGVTALRAVFDHRAGMTDATTHLLDLGHRDVGIIIGGPTRPARERRRAIEETLWPRGGRAVTAEASFGIEGGYQAAMTLLHRVPRPTAIIAGGNSLMSGALRAIHELNLDIGRDISFVGCDHSMIAELHYPPIAIVTRDASHLGREAAKLLLQTLNADDATHLDLDDIRIPTQFLPRASCAPPPPTPN